jgi:hypothetical protein
MFNKKVDSLIGAKTKTTTSSAFVNAGHKVSSMTTALGNNAVKFKTTGNDFVDQFGKITNYRQPRSYQEIADDMYRLWSQDPENTMALLFYIRLVTRTVQLPNGTKTSTTQRGQGLKHEGIMRMTWVAINHPETFQKNLPLFIVAGSWKDVFQMLSTDLQFHGWNGRKLDWTFIGKVLLSGLENPSTTNLVKKYLPQIKANSQCKTLESQADNIIAKWVCSLLFGSKESSFNYKQYRKLKTSGTAHQWQQLISQGKTLDLDFNTVAGRALAQLVSSKFLDNQGLTDRYTKWIETQPVAKYTGYVYELLAPVKSGYRNNNIPKHQEMTINAQFMGLIETAKKGMNDESSLLVVVDTSSSMTSNVPGLKVSSYDVAKAMALYFSYLLKGPFSGAWMEFNNNAELKKWTGKTPVERLKNDNSEAYGSTDFQSVARLFAQIKAQGAAESEFPTGILVMSDGCFNSTSKKTTETKTLKQNLLNAGFSKEYVDNFKICIWDIPNGYYNGSQTAFEEYADYPNLFYMSGLDGSAISFLTGATAKEKATPKNAEELFHAAMDQELFGMIEI